MVKSESISTCEICGTKYRHKHSVNALKRAYKCELQGWPKTPEFGDVFVLGEGYILFTGNQSRVKPHQNSDHSTPCWSAPSIQSFKGGSPDSQVMNYRALFHVSADGSYACSKGINGAFKKLSDEALTNLLQINKSFRTLYGVAVNHYSGGPSYLDKGLEDLPLPERVRSTLISAGFRKKTPGIVRKLEGDIGDLVEKTEDHFLRTKGCGPKRLAVIRAILTKRGLDFQTK